MIGRWWRRDRPPQPCQFLSGCRAQPIFFVLLSMLVANVPLATASKYTRLTFAAPQNFQLNSVALSDLRVNYKSDLEWTFQSNYAVQAGDCLIFEFPDPYANDPNQIGYQSFNETGPALCTFSSDHSGSCNRTSAQGFKIVFDQPSSSKKIVGATTAHPFHNPRSTRRLNTFQVKLFSACNTSTEATVAGETQRSTTFVAGAIQQVELTSNSVVIGATDAELTLRFTPATTMPISGTISLIVPSWYLAASTKQGASVNKYEGSVLDFDSQVSQTSGSPLDFIARFDQHAQTISLNYLALSEWMDEIILKFTNFKNPISQSTLGGFKLVTSDDLSFIIDKTYDDLVLSTKAITPQPLAYTEFEPIGDSNGQNVGTVGVSNTIQFTVGALFPLEPYCVFQFTLPPELELDEISQVKGTGIFEPEGGSSQYSSTLYDYIGGDSRIFTVTGCLNPDTFTTRPFGTLEVSSALMPNYVVQAKPIQIQVFTDKFKDNLVMDQLNGATLTPEKMSPGNIDLSLFEPSNPFAFAQDVSYSMNVAPENGFQPGMRLRIQMPKTLVFKDDCEIQQGQCSIDKNTNLVTISDISNEIIPKRSLFKILLKTGANPYGARDCGPWSVSTEINVKGTWYVVDFKESQESFYAKPGYINSKVQLDSRVTYATGTKYTFECETEHAIPQDGFIVLKVPDSTEVTAQVQAGRLRLASMTPTEVRLAVPNGHGAGDRITFEVTGIRNPRSFRPSNAFVISTKDKDGYLIDQGGDTNAIMDQMNEFEKISITPLDLTNGFVGTYNISIDSRIQLRNGDKLIVVLPEEISVPGAITCSSTTASVQNVSCSSDGSSFYVNLDQITEEFGIYGVLVTGIRNPPSFKPSSNYKQIYLTDSDGFNIQKVHDYSSFYIQTNKVAQIIKYDQQQSTEQYGEDTDMQLVFWPVNPLPQNAFIKITWPDQQVAFYPDTQCSVSTYKQFTDSNACSINLQSSVIDVRGIFDSDNYQGGITFGFSRLTNPITNRNLQNYVLSTFTDASMQYPMDELLFTNVLECYYTCRFCGHVKDFCTACWPGDSNIFLQRLGDNSTCQDACSPGYTTNGDDDLYCTPCDPSCKTCADNGLVGDLNRCKECAPDFDLMDLRTGECLATCPPGHYDKLDGTCGACDPTCGSCIGTPTNCTMCNTDSLYPVLLSNRCEQLCPYGYATKGSVCEPCESPCATCNSSVQACLSCDGSLGRKLRFGPQCLANCPEGTTTDNIKNVCTGCLTGCNSCTEENPGYCLECDYPLLVFKGECLTACPHLTQSNYEQTECLELGDLDANKVYFPVMMVTLVLLAISFVGKWVKPRHQILTNFVIMESMLEHLSIIAQVFLAFAYTNPIWGVLALLLWAAYVAMNLLFFRGFNSEVVEKDITYRRWRDKPQNVWTNRMITFLGTWISWRSYKLLYSHFFGYKINTTDFSDSHAYQVVMKKLTMLTIYAVYAPMFVLNLICLVTISWGDQLFIDLIENMIIAVAMTICTYLEHKLMFRHQENDAIRRNKKREQMKLMSVLDEDGTEITTNKSLAKMTKSDIFRDLSIEQLVEEFGGRNCKSMGDYQKSFMEPDPRHILTHPITPKTHVNVSDPPKPLGPILVNNCYHEPKQKSELTELKPLDGKGRNKAIQCGGPFDNDLLRSDSEVVTTHMQTPGQSRASKAKRPRGRKNRYFAQIDLEDHNAGAILDSDDEGETANRKARADHLRAIREEDEQMQKLPELKDDVRAVLEEQMQQQKVQAQLEALKAEDQMRKSAFSAKIAAEEQSINPRPKQGQTQNSMQTPIKVQPSTSLQTPGTGGKHVSLQQRSPNVLPDVKSRWFNENDVLGEFERGPSGEPRLRQTTDGVFLDQNHCRVTRQGYLLDPNGNVIDNTTSQIVFRDLEDELPAPFCLEKYNFNPFEITGCHNSFYDTRDSTTFNVNKDQGLTFDGKQRRINYQGFLVDEGGNLLQPSGRIVFRQWQLTDGGIPALYTYEGKPFTIHEVMGCFPKLDGTIPKLQKDASGRLVNERGYLVTREGHICNRSGKVLFDKDALKGGEFPKFFHYSKLPQMRLDGEVEFDVNGLPQLRQSRGGHYVDNRARLVNQRGFLVDARGNVVDLDGNVMFEKHLLSKEGDLPALFRKQLHTKDE